MNIEKNIDAFCRLGERLRAIASGKIDAEVQSAISSASSVNPWFTRENILNALGAIGESLEKVNLEKWIVPYRGRITVSEEKKIIGVINAGNIPAVGFHDFLSVLLSGNIYHGKNSSDDASLLPFIAAQLKKNDPEFEENIFFVERISNPHAVIATGSNNSARYFEYYFGKYPHIIRKNRNGVAVLNGKESVEELSGLADDVFQYFGLGCRNVSKIFLPAGFNLKRLFDTFEKFARIAEHHRYMNNFNYQRVILMMNKITFLENGFVILREDSSLHSPISVLCYEYYKNEEDIFEKFYASVNEIQCIACGNEFKKKFQTEKLQLVPFGQTQKPMLWNYADGVDTMEFLTGL